MTFAQFEYGSTMSYKSWRGRLCSGSEPGGSHYFERRHSLGHRNGYGDMPAELDPREQAVYDRGRPHYFRCNRQRIAGPDFVPARYLECQRHTQQRAMSKPHLGRTTGRAV
jgi:hypothetical protein